MLTAITISITLAASQCGPREILLNDLSTKYKESIVQVDVAPNGKHSQALFYNRKTGTFTIAMFDTKGRACVLGSGKVKPKKMEDT